MSENDVMGVFEPYCKVRFISDPAPEDEYVAIDLHRYSELLAAEMKLLALEGSGVDNWVWYCDAIHDYLKELPECYGDKFWDWVRNEKSKDQTVEDFVNEMDIKDFADFEAYVLT